MAKQKIKLHVNKERIGVGKVDIDRVAKVVEPTGVRSPRNLIKLRRESMLVHSYIYYECDANAISDDQWQLWANDLVVLQDSFPEECKQDYYDELFVDWDASTGSHLTYDKSIRKSAERTYRMFKGRDLHEKPRT